MESVASSTVVVSRGDGVHSGGFDLEIVGGVRSKVGENYGVGSVVASLVVVIHGVRTDFSGVGILGL